ncbi:MAG: ABC transporter substrate-binding protein [Pseudomonadota bacterium]
MPESELPAGRVPAILRAARLGVVALAMTVPAIGTVLVAPVAAIAAEASTVSDRERARVVSIGTAVTEILYALDLQNRIIAVDTTSMHPPEALEQKPNVGYMRALSAEGVLALDPSMVLAEEGAGPPEVIGLLEAASVPFITVPSDPSPDGVADKIRMVARVMGREAAGDRLAAETATYFDELAAAREGLDDRLRVMFILSLQSGRVLASGAGTAAAGILALAGADNAVAGFEGYKPLSDEAILAAAPDVILVMNRGNHVLDADQVFGLPALSNTPAARTRALIRMDGAYLLGFGPRTPAAAVDLARALYPEHAWPETANGNRGNTD